MEIITAILGIIAGFLPEVIKYLKQKTEFIHELELKKLELEKIKLTAEYGLKEAEIARDSKETEVVYAYAPPPQQSSIKWIDGIIYALNGFFRPAVSFYLFIFYILAKYNPAVAVYWTDFDRGLIAGIFSFFFTNRAMRYAMGQLGNRIPNNQPILTNTTKPNNTDSIKPNTNRNESNNINNESNIYTY